MKMEGEKKGAENLHSLMLRGESIPVKAAKVTAWEDVIFCNLRKG
jgi:hypothetical protein